MDTIDKYIIWQDIGNTPGHPEKFEPRYQITEWIESTLVAGVQTVVIPTIKANNSLFIKINQISVTTDGLGGTITFRDSRLPNPLFSIINNISTWSMNNFVLVIANTGFTLVSNSATVKFSLGFTRITKDKKH